MGVGELNNCYEDAELADTIVAIGTNPLETQTNYFLNHWVPNLRGTSVDKKRKEFAGEPVEAGRIIIIDPRRTVTVAACEAEAGKDKVLHLALESGTDLVLFNALLTYIADKGWIDKAFIAASTLRTAANLCAHCIEAGRRGGWGDGHQIANRLAEATERWLRETKIIRTHETVVMSKVARSTLELHRSSTRLNPRNTSGRSALDLREITATFSRPVSR